MTDNRGAFKGQFVGNGNNGFLVNPGISDESIKRQFEEIAAVVVGAFEQIHEIFGNSKFSDGIASAILNDKAMYAFDKVDFLSYCMDATKVFDINSIYIMVGRPGYYGDHTIYICAIDGATAENSNEIKNNIRNSFYGSLPLPIAKITKDGLVKMDNTRAVMTTFKYHGFNEYDYHYEFD